MTRQEYMREYMKKYYEKNQAKITARSKEWYENNKDRVIARSNTPEAKARKSISDKNYWAKAPDLVKEKRKNAIARWAKENPKKRYANEKKRQERIKLATPPWQCLNEIDLFYANRPEGMTVDHIIPLQGKNVCGLHVLSNLQYLTVQQNSQKSNKI